MISVSSYVFLFSFLFYASFLLFFCACRSHALFSVCAQFTDIGKSPKKAMHHRKRKRIAIFLRRKRCVAEAKHEKAFFFFERAITPFVFCHSCWLALCRLQLVLLGILRPASADIDNLCGIAPLHQVLCGIANAVVSQTVWFQVFQRCLTSCFKSRKQSCPTLLLLLLSLSFPFLFVSSSSFVPPKLRYAVSSRNIFPSSTGFPSCTPFCFFSVVGFSLFTGHHRL